MIPERRITAQELVLTGLRTDILTGELGPGDQVVQELLAERYGVSRVPLREALKTLESEGQVVYYPHRGYFVAELSVADLMEVYRLRSLLEAEAIRHAVPALNDGDVDDLADLLAEVDAASRAEDVLAMTAANRRFHFAIFDAAGMPRLTRLLHQLWDATDAYRALYFQQSINRSRVGREHARMLAALRAREALKPLMALFPFASCVPFGRERIGVLFRAASYEAPPDEVLTRIEALLGLAGADTLRYADKKKGQHRAMRLVRDGATARLEGFVLAGDTRAEAWIKTLLQDELPAQAYGRLLLSPGAKAPVSVTDAAATRGKQVCTCFNVNDLAIQDHLNQCAGSEHARLASLQAALKCGTNCGSCVPELKRMVRVIRHIA